MANYNEYSIPDLISLLGERFRDYRIRYGMTQKDVAAMSGITVNTIHKFENGVSGNVSLRTFLLLMKTIRRLESIDDMLPDAPISPYLLREEKKVQRVRHKNNDS